MGTRLVYLRKSQKSMLQATQKITIVALDFKELIYIKQSSVINMSSINSYKKMR